MQQDLEGGEQPARKPGRSAAIDQLCLDPADTRRRANTGEATPCHRCLAFEPLTPTGCRFLEQRTPRLEAPAAEPTEQLTIESLHTSDTMEKR